jgi:ribosomal protein S10
VTLLSETVVASPPTLNLNMEDLSPITSSMKPHSKKGWSFHLGFASPLTWNVRPTRGFLPQAVGDWAKIEKTAKYFVGLSSTPVPEQCNRSWLRSSDPFSDRLKLAKRNGESLFFQSSYGLALPRLQKKWTVLRSPHIDKKSREQFEWTRCKEKIHIFSTQREVTLYLLSLLRHSEIPGVELELQLQSLTFFKRTATK